MYRVKTTLRFSKQEWLVAKVNVVRSYHNLRTMCFVFIICYINACNEYNGIPLARLQPNSLRQHNMPIFVRKMACRLSGAKPLSEPMLPYCQLDPKEYNSVNFYSTFKRMHLKMPSAKWRPFCLGLHVLRNVVTSHTFTRLYQGYKRLRIISGYVSEIIHANFIHYPL